MTHVLMGAALVYWRCSQHYGPIHYEKIRCSSATWLKPGPGHGELTTASMCYTMMQIGITI